jgi:integrase
LSNYAPRKLKKPRIIASWDDGQAVLNQTTNLRDRLAVRLGLYLGLREGEIFGSQDKRHGNLEPLKLNQINLENKTVTIKGKGDKRYIIFIDKNTLDVLVNYTRVYNVKKNASLFKMSTRQFQRIVKDLARKANVPNADRFSPHVLRAISITYMCHRKDALAGQLHARHTSLTMTQIYNRPTDQQRQEVFNLVFED